MKSGSENKITNISSRPVQFIAHVLPTLLIISIAICIFIVSYVDRYRDVGIYAFFNHMFLPNPFRPLPLILLLFTVTGVIGAHMIIHILLTPGNSICKTVPVFCCFCIVLIVPLVILINKISVTCHRQASIIELRDDLASERTIIHACGAIYDSAGNLCTYTNSLEAIENTIDSGNRFIEVDFDFSADGYLVCTHELESPVTEAEFMSEKANGEFTHMNLDTVAKIMHNHPQIHVITDIKGNNVSGCSQIREKYPELTERFIIQVYHDSEYEEIRELGFKYLIFTLYNTKPAERDYPVLKKCFDAHDYVGLTFKHKWIAVNPSDYEGYDTESNSDDFSDFSSDMKRIGVPIYTHTVDSIDTILYDLQYGAAAVYTNNTENEWIKREKIIID